MYAPSQDDRKPTALEQGLAAPSVSLALSHRQFTPREFYSCCEDVSCSAQRLITRFVRLCANAFRVMFC